MATKKRGGRGNPSNRGRGRGRGRGGVTSNAAGRSSSNKTASKDGLPTATSYLESIVTTSKIVTLDVSSLPGTAIAREPLLMDPDPHENFDVALKSTVQTLYTLQSNMHGYLGPETQTALIQNIKTLSSNLSHITTTSQGVSKNLPPELIGYLDERKNPNIYTREFVELTSKGNRYLNGKVQALEFFRDSLFRQMQEEWPEMEEGIGRILGGRGDGGKEEEDGVGDGRGGGGYEGGKDEDKGEKKERNGEGESGKGEEEGEGAGAKGGLPGLEMAAAAEEQK